MDIALLKKCKTVDVPAVNSAIGNVQKALQKYVGFNGMDSDYCDKIGDLMDQAQSWCVDIKDLYNKAEVHSIITFLNLLSSVQRAKIKKLSACANLVLVICQWAREFQPWRAIPWFWCRSRHSMGSDFSFAT